MSKKFNLFLMSLICFGSTAFADIPQFRCPGGFKTLLVCEGSAQTLRSSVSVSVQLCEINGQYFLGQWDSGMHFNDEPKPYFRSANLLNEGDAEPLFRGRYEDNRTSGMLRVNPKTLNGIYSDFSPSDLVVNVKCKK